MLPNYQARSPFVLKHTTSMYICMDEWYVCPLNARAWNFFLQKTRLFRLDPILFWNYSIKRALLYTSANKYEKFPAKTLAFQETKSWFDRLLWHWRPFSRINLKNSPFYGGIRSADCWLSRVIGNQNAVVLMLRKLQFFEGSWGKYAIPYLLAKYAKLILAFLFCS